MFPFDTIALSLLDSSGNVIDEGMLPFPKSFDTDQAVLYRQLKLYSAPNQPIPPGAYTIRAALPGKAVGTLNIEVR